jgi:hypothetical protein
LPALLEVTHDLAKTLGRPLGSHLTTAGPVVWRGR